MTQHALHVGGQYVPITCGYTWAIPKLQRVGTTQYTPYGPPWDDGVDEQGRVQYRAAPSTLELLVGGRTAQEAADAAELWAQRVLSASRIQFTPSGRFMRLLLARELGERDPVRGTLYKLAFQLEYLDPYWHSIEGDGSTRLHP